MPGGQQLDRITGLPCYPSGSQRSYSPYMADKSASQKLPLHLPLSFFIPKREGKAVKITSQMAGMIAFIRSTACLSQYQQRSLCRQSPAKRVPFCFYYRFLVCFREGNQEKFMKSFLNGYPLPHIAGTSSHWSAMESAIQ